MYAALATLAVVALVSMIVTRIAAGALVATGLPPDVARFQARSAFTGVGFTTDESSVIVRHPQRRKVAFHLMMLGNLGTATVVASLIIGLLAPGPLGGNVRFLVVLGALVVAFLVLRSTPLDRAFNWLGLRAGPRWLDRDLAGAPFEMAEVHGEHVVLEVTIGAGADGAADRRRLDLPNGSALVLGVIGPDGSYRDVWAPNGAATYAPGETVVLFGERPNFRQLAGAGGES